MKLRLGHSLDLLQPSLHNGPGWRISLWTQGCSVRCTLDCLNPQYLSPQGGRLYEAEEVAAVLIRIATASDCPVEGLTLLGGEPLDQSEAVARMLRQTREAGLSTMLYSGREFDVLRRDPNAGIAAVLELTDILVDGPFRPEEYADDLCWRGSRNQRIHCLSPRYSTESLEQAYQRQGKGYSLVVLPDGRFSLSGLQSTSGMRALRNLTRPACDASGPDSG
jgi:anaerobic ribonucleoside-triphosphate reductase activating protein